MRNANPLALKLARLIEGSGPITLTQYMAEANAEYYNKSDPLGRDGDFITAPEVSQMFGELVGLWLADLWMRMNNPTDVHYVELGPGRGTLANDAMRSMAQFGFTPDCHFVETSEALRAKQAENHPDALWHDGIRSLPEDGPLLIIANEFFDALPIRQIAATHAGWRERVVARDGQKFMALAGSRAMDEHVPEEFQKAQPGSILESSPISSDIAYELCKRIERQGGVLLIIDYGYSELATGETLQAVNGHAPADPFENPGENDLTAHVNFGALVNIGRASMMKVNGPVAQGSWLKRLGIDQRAEGLITSSPEHEDDVRSAHHRLTDETEMGDLFKVLAMSSTDWPTPEGFTE